MSGFYLRFREADHLDPSAYITSHLITLTFLPSDSIRVCVPIRMYIFLLCKFCCIIALIFEKLP